MLPFVVPKFTYNVLQERYAPMIGRENFVHLLQLAVTIVSTRHHAKEQNALLVVVFSYNSLNSLCTSHGGFFSHQSRRCAKAEALNFRNTAQDGRSYSML